MIKPQRSPTSHFERLRSCARGDHGKEAATELLIRSFGGLYATIGHPWIHIDNPDRAHIDFDELARRLHAGGTWSAAEHRLLTLAASLGADDGFLRDNVPNLTRDHLALMLAAISHAGGSHEHTPVPVFFDSTGHPHRNPDRQRLGPLYPWPSPL